MVKKLLTLKVENFEKNVLNGDILVMINGNKI